MGQHHLLSRVHASHRLCYHEGHLNFFFCAACAGWTGKLTLKKLAAECKGTHSGKQADRRKLLDGFRVLRSGASTYCGRALPLAAHDALDATWAQLLHQRRCCTTSSRAKSSSPAATTTTLRAP